MNRKENNIYKIVNELEKETLIQKYKYKHIWLSGSSTQVYPIMIYKNNTENTIEIRIQIRVKRNYFKGLLDKYKKYDNYLCGWFDKTDSSCPSVLVLKFNLVEEVRK